MRLNERRDQFASMLDAIQNYAPHHRLAQQISHAHGPKDAG
jgi:hypothetical protein